MVKVKICGITNIDDALAAVDFGADALGFVFFKKSPRYVLPEKAAAIIKELPPFIQTVGVFANEQRENIEAVIAASRIDLVQLHGDEDPAMCKLTKRVVKGIRIKSLDSLAPLGRYAPHVSAFLLDAYTADKLGGTGMIFNWDIAVEAKQFGKIILAGGLTTDNVSKAVKYVKPYGVDVSSGVELAKGKKDLGKMKLFIEKAKGAV
jgi:phosphoribosylanthranilate isomerase